MKFSKSFLFFIICLHIGLLTFGQNRQSEYLEAKRLYQINDYVSAESAFRSLETDPVFGAYAGFFRGLSLFKQGQFTEANLIWMKVRGDYPSWEKEIELLYWLSVSSFEMKDFDNGLNYLTQYTNRSLNVNLAEQLIPFYLGEMEVNRLVRLQDKYNDLRPLANLLAVKINQEAGSERNEQLFNELITKYELPIQSVMALDVSNVKKSVYDVAVVLPFVFDGLQNPTATIRNTLVMDLYQGIQLAVDELEKQGVFVRLHAFDSYKEADSVMQYESELATMDLIIGPLYPGPIEAVKTISRTYKINMISPLTSNSSYMDGNPYAFMAKASYETLAKRLAEFVASQDHKKSAFIYFSKDERDSLFAENYKEHITSRGIDVLAFKSVDALGAKKELDLLTEVYEHYYSKSEGDSIAELEGRFVKTRKLREEEKKDSLLMAYSYYELDENGMLTNQESPVRMLSYEEKLKVDKDTVGHLLIVSRSMSIYNNFVSAKAARQDSMGIYGYTNWFDNKLVNYNLMDQVDAKVAVTEHLDQSSDAYVSFRDSVISSIQKMPSEYHVQGYDLMYYLGHMLWNHGKYFQFGAYTSGRVMGPFMQGYEFSGANDNQIVPILQLEDYFIEVINR